MKKTTKLLLGSAAILAVGSMIGVLCAPGKGNCTRRKMGCEVKRFLAGAKDKMESCKDAVKH